MPETSTSSHYRRRDRRVRLEDAIEDLRRRFGKKSLTYAGLLGNLKMPDDGRGSVTTASPRHPQR